MAIDSPTPPAPPAPLAPHASPTRPYHWPGWIPIALGAWLFSAVARPPLPPHIEVRQARKLMEALLKGDPRRWRVIKQSAKELWAGLVT
jgi:hypothetical protein